jgi:hypothetical protein
LTTRGKLQHRIEGEFIMIKRSKVAMAIAFAAPLALAIATAGNSQAAPMLSGAGALKAASSSAVTDVQYYYGPYGYYPAYRYGGYTYWYPTYRNWAYPGDYYYYNWW